MCYVQTDGWIFQDSFQKTPLCVCATEMAIAFHEKINLTPFGSFLVLCRVGKQYEMNSSFM